MPDEGGVRLLRERSEPMPLCALGSAWHLARDPGLTQRARVLDAETLVPAVNAYLSRRVPRPPSDGRPATPVEVLLRMLVVKHR
jgi:IS5 family transposase